MLLCSRILATTGRPAVPVSKNQNVSGVAILYWYVNGVNLQYIYFSKNFYLWLYPFLYHLHQLLNMEMGDTDVRFLHVSIHALSALC
jgi:hypothetical protein